MEIHRLVANTLFSIFILNGKISDMLDFSCQCTDSDSFLNIFNICAALYHHSLTSMVSLSGIVFIFMQAGFMLSLLAKVSEQLSLKISNISLTSSVPSLTYFLLTS